MNCEVMLYNRNNRRKVREVYRCKKQASKLRDWYQDENSYFTYVDANGRKFRLSFGKIAENNMYFQVTDNQLVKIVFEGLSD